MGVQTNGEELETRIISMAEQGVHLSSRLQQPSPTTDFVDGSERVDQIVEQYLALMDSDELDGKHLTTMLFMAIKAAEQCGVMNNFTQRYSTFVSRVINGIRYPFVDNQRLSGIVWALGKLGPDVQNLPLSNNRSVGDFIEITVDLCARRLSGFQAQQLARTIMAFARLNCRSAGVLVPTLTTRCQVFRKQLKGADLCGIAVALGSLNVDNAQPLMESLALTIRERVSSITPVELSQFIWACGRLRSKIAPDIMSAIMFKIEANMRFLKIEDLCQVLWALTQISFRPRFEFLDMMEVYVTNQITSFKPTDVTTMLHALAEFGYTPTTLLQVTKAFVLDYQNIFTAEQCSSIARSLALLDAGDLELVKIAIDKTTARDTRRLVDGNMPLEMQDDSLRHLYHCLLHWEILKKEKIDQLFPPGLIERCQRSWESFYASIPTNAVTAHVLHNFEYIGYRVDSLLMDEKAHWRLNCVRKGKGVRIVVEVVSEEKGFVNAKHRLQGPEKWRHQIISECGWPLLVIFEDVWMTMDFQEQKEYLLKNVLPLIH